MLQNRSLSLNLLTVVLLLAFLSSCRQQGPAKVLVFSKTRGWHHGSIPFGQAAIQQIGKEQQFGVDTTSDAAVFTDDNLRQYRAVIFDNTTGNVLNSGQQAAFERYIQAGGGFVGIHSAADTEYDWPWYGKLLGAYFESHPRNSNVRKAMINVTDTAHPASKGLPAQWERTDEWYNYRSFYTDIKVLASLDESTYEGGTNGANHPISWYHAFDGGRAFYTGLGHTDESYKEPLFLQHLTGGILYAMGDGTPLDYDKAYSIVTPEENRFVKTVLKDRLDNPMEVAVSNDGRVFFTELFGKLSVYDTRTSQYRLLHKFPVTTTGGTGLIGLTLDPHFDSNHFLYVYYAPGGQTEEPLYFNLSRFTLTPDNTIDTASEKIFFRVPVQKNSGSHHGGSLAWDAARNLYLSTGDGSSPFPSNGYSPMDERPGPEHYSLDAQRGPANTNDFKGKILRIHPEPDGTYTIPEGNLFPKGTDKTKQEIYVMGARNPYRIAVNPKTGVLYWGEIGPDAGNDSKRGPRGYDEFNQARKAGNFGWPYIIANNLPYAKWDFTTDSAGPLFDPKRPVNNSPNNTGLNVLPPAMPAMIWYPYAASDKFPELGIGGRSAMAGAFYTYDESNKAPGKFPAYYDGSLFVFDWMRNWVINLRFDKDENYLRNEPFMAANGDFRRPIDLAFGKDGIMYMLEYGSVYGMANEDAQLVKIEYNSGNRAPLAKANIVDSAAMAKLDKEAFLTTESKNVPIIKEIAGQPPLRVSFTGKGSKDLDDDDEITYQWSFDGQHAGATASEALYTYTTPGIYKAILKVTDKAGATASDTLTVKVGNTAPVVTISTPDNTSFYQPGQPFRYSIQVMDKEDGVIDPANIKAWYIYTPQSYSNEEIIRNLGNLAVLTETNITGKNIVTASDCKTCHIIDKDGIGPGFLSVANRYKDQPGALDKLAAKIINGGAGSWGTEHVMNAHPQLTTEDTKEIVRYIFSLTDKQKTQTAIPWQGSLKLTYNEKEPKGQHVMVVTYTDKGSPATGPLTTTAVVRLRNKYVRVVNADQLNGYPRFRDNLSEGAHKSFFLLKDVDLTSVKGFTYRYACRDQASVVEVRLDSRSGPVVSSTPYTATGSGDKFSTVTGTLDKPVTGKHDVYFIAVKPTRPNDAIIKWGAVQFNF
jgi:cytochrome c